MPRKREQYHCPPEFTDRLSRVGGLNRYGLPNFRIVWGQSWTVRRGGTWEQDDGTYFRGYRDVLEDGRPCWILKKWNPPEVYGTPAIWFIENYEASTGLQILGDYPWRGQYETVQPFVWRGMVNGRMVVERMPLNSMILNMVVPIILKCKEVSFLQKKAAIQEMDERKKRAEDSVFEAKRHDAKMAFTGPVSFARQGCRTSLVDQKVHAIEKHWNQAMARFRKQGLGISLMN
jgi:hypothetical protein